MDDALSFGTLLKRYRRAAGLTQEELAEKALLSARAISDLERGVNRTARRDTVWQLAQALDLTSEERGALESASRADREPTEPAGIDTEERSSAITDGLTHHMTSDVRVFLIAEVRDYTPFSQERGDEEATRLVERFARLARQVVERRAGKVIELRGDEALAVFGSARQALRAAVELQVLFIEETRRDPSLPLRVGIGLDAGEAMPFEQGYRGRALNLAARLKDQARAGQVLATEALIHIAGQMHGLAYVEQGLVQPKGFALPVDVFQVVLEGQQRHEMAPPDEPELRTFLFADILGYMDLVMQIGDVAGADLQSWYASIAGERVRARGGRVLEIAGDTVFAAFVSPRQAIHAAIELQERFHQAIEVERQLPITLATGLETGEAIPIRGKYAGSAVNLAARICSLAGPGEVLIGETLHRLVRSMDGLLFLDRGQVQVKGYPDPIRIVQVARENPAAPEGSTSVRGAGAQPHR